MLYERKIKYLDYLVKGERCGNGGFVKLEVRDELCNISISVSGLREADSIPVKVYIIDGEKERELCSLELIQGRGMKRILGQNTQNINHTGIAYQNLKAVKIPISAERELYGVLEEQSLEQSQSKTPKPEQILVPVGQVEKIVEMVEEPLEEPLENPSVQAAESEIGEAGMPLHDNKWKQLWTIYPHIKPFQDEREYLSVGPNDFVVLSEKYFRMANNSFLLHGYYNYKHLVLKKIEYHGEARYYIGVPGNFYDREKQVAVMFGFESFEGGEEPAEAGDYGYYLMRIEL